MQPAAPITRDLVLLGGGHAHAILLRMWGMDPLPGARLTLVSPNPTAPYTGMLPGHVAGAYARDALEIDLVRLARFAGARLILDRACGTDLEAKTVRLEGRPPIAYDILSIDIGVTSDAPDLPYANRFVAPAKPLDGFADAWEAFLAAVTRGEKPPTFVVIGGGIGGVELALAMKARLASLADHARGAVVERNADLLPQAAVAARNRLKRALTDADIEIATGAADVQARDGRVRLGDGRTIDAAFVAVAAGARPAPWLSETGLALHEGFVRVDRHLRSINDPAVFAVGDAAHLEASPRAKAGVFAVRAGPVLHHNLQAALAGHPLKPFRPQKDYLKLIGLGNGRALAEKWGIAASGAWAWRLKDHIDRKFMRRFDDLPPMAATPARPAGALAAEGLKELEAAQPTCGGCGSKVGRDALGAGLAGIGCPQRTDILKGGGDDAAVLSASGSSFVLTTDHFRAFSEDPYDLAHIAAVHAMGDIWAMGAEPQAALASLVLPPMSPQKQAATIREILDGASAAFGASGAEIAGGHTSLGAELVVGFTVTGIPSARVIGLDGAMPGDALILTKPVGVGVILAAEMRGLATGRVLANALAQMRRPSGKAAAILRGHAHAMTDVTGFGLAGHLLAMLDASNAGARLSLRAVPWTEGAIALSESGVASSIFPDNARAAERIEADDATRADARWPLLFDPQTSGGLLAAAPASASVGIVEALRGAGETAAIIGEVTEATALAVRA